MPKPRANKQSTKVGKKGALKKTTKKGAYALKSKKAINTKLRPMVETKNWKDSDLARS